MKDNGIPQSPILENDYCIMALKLYPIKNC